MILLNHALAISNKIDGATTFLSFLPEKQPEFSFLPPPVLIVAVSSLMHSTLSAETHSQVNVLHPVQWKHQVFKYDLSGSSVLIN